MAEVASAYVSLLPSAKGFGTKMQSDLKGEVSTSGTTLGKTFGKVFAVAGAAIAALGIGSFLKGSIAEAREAQKVTAITEQIIKSTGGTAKVTATQVAELANAISLKTGIDDEAIQTGSNLLLTFKNIRNEVGKGNDIFNQATAAAVDLSAAGFGSIDSASKMLGKALNDPLKGLTALGRAGVTFTAQQEERIKGYVAEGNLLKAQGVILGEVRSQVGGVAEASATAGEKAAVAWANLKEQLGTALLPVIDAVANVFATKVIPALSTFIAQVQAGTGVGGAFRDVFTAVFNAIGAAAEFMGTKVIPVIAGFINGIRSGTGAGGRFREILTQIGGAVVRVAGFLADTFGPTLRAIGEVIQTQVIPAVQKIIAKFREWWPSIQPVVEWLAKTWAQALKLGLTIVGKVLPPIIRFASFLAGRVVESISMVVSWIGTVVSKFADFVGAVRNAINKVPGLSTAINGVVNSIKTLVSWIGNAISALVRLLDLQGDVAFKGQQLGPWGTSESPGTASRPIAPSAQIPSAASLGMSSGSAIAELRALRVEMARNTTAVYTVAPGINGIVADGHRRRVA